MSWGLKIAVLGFSAAVLLQPRDAAAVSFECRKVVNADETAICANPQLSAKDDELSHLYRALRRQLSGAALQKFINAGRMWITMRHACAAEVSCLDRWYDARIAALQLELPSTTNGTASAPVRDTDGEAERQREQADVAATRRLREQAEARERADAAQRAADEEKAQRLAAAEQAKREQEERDRDYTKESVEEVIVDYPQMDGSAKVIVSGYFTSLGQIASLSSDRFSLHDISLDTRELSRDTRLALLKCQNIEQGCLITVWAHRGCAVTVLGYENDAAPCFVVEAIRPGTYTNPIMNGILR